MSYVTFLFAAAVLAVTPRPGIAYVVARTVAGGRSEGLASCLGTGIGGMLHVLAAALGLSLIIAQSAVAFSLVKYLGAAYLIYLGIRLLLRKDPELTVKPVAPQGVRRALADGVAVEALNVKTALFFLAFLPQFVSRDCSPRYQASRCWAWVPTWRWQGATPDRTRPARSGPFRRLPNLPVS